MEVGTTVVVLQWLMLLSNLYIMSFVQHESPAEEEVPGSLTEDNPNLYSLCMQQTIFILFDVFFTCVQLDADCKLKEAGNLTHIPKLSLKVPYVH